MPVLHDYECTKCKAVFEKYQGLEERTASCTKCDGTGTRIVSRLRSSQIDIFEGQHFEELGDDNPFISSKRQLAEECEKRGLKSRLLMEGYSSHARPAWI